MQPPVRFADGVGVAGGAGVAVGGAGLAVGGAGVAVGGAGVAVGVDGAGVAVDGAGVAVDGAGVAVDGAGVAVGGGGGAEPEHPAVSRTTASVRRAVRVRVMARAGRGLLISFSFRLYAQAKASGCSLIAGGLK